MDPGKQIGINDVRCFAVDNALFIALHSIGLFGRDKSAAHITKISAHRLCTKD